MTGAGNLRDRVGDLDDPVEVDLADEVIPIEELAALAASDVAVQEIAEQTTYGEILLEDLIRRQLTLSVSVAAVFLAILFGLPLVNVIFPQVMALPFFGLPLAWLILAVLVYPTLWALAAYFVSTSQKYEDEFTKLVK